MYECDGNNSGKCTIMWGICNHVHCMSGLTKNRNTCLLSNSEWGILRVE
jgi:hypothetical protein